MSFFRVLEGWGMLCRLCGWLSSSCGAIACIKGWLLSFGTTRGVARAWPIFFMALSNAFHSINSPYNSPLSLSVLLVLFLFFLLVISTTYLFVKVSSSSDIMLCGWLGLKPQLTKLLRPSTLATIVLRSRQWKTPTNGHLCVSLLQAYWWAILSRESTTPFVAL